VVVLIVDDSRVIRERVASRIAEIDGVASVMQAAGGAEALERMKTELPQLLVLDLHMPGIHGLSVLDHVHQRTPDLPVVVLTHHPEYTQLALRRGATYVFDKATQMDALFETIAGLAVVQEALGG
jgi:CheY-like chemotaxis protein